jgi:MFS transporter, DHA3 family, macrolide efflux protein
MSLGASFLFFLTSTTLSTLALYCLRFGVSWMVMHETASAAAFAVVFSASSLVEVYSKPLLSPLADYFDRLKVYRTCVALGSAVIVMLMLAVVALPFSVPLIAGLLMALSLVAGLRDPASAGLVPTLVTAERLTQAQSYRSSASSVIGLVAPLLSALLLAIGGIPAALGAAALSAALSAVMTFGVKRMRSDVVPAPKRWADYSRTWHLRIADGVRAVIMTRSERTMALAVAITNAGLLPFFTVVLPLWVSKGMGATATTMAIIEAGFGIGILAGGAYLTLRMNNALGRFQALVVGNGLLGAGVAVAALFDHPFVLSACFVVAGAGFAVFNVNASTLRAAATPPAFRSRMAAGVSFLSSCLNPFAMQGMGFVIESFGATFAVSVCGGLILLSTALLMCNADAKSLLMRSNEDILGAYASLYPKAFAERQHAA